MPLAAALRGAAAVLDLSLGVLLKPPLPRIVALRRGARVLADGPPARGASDMATTS
jgi:hypothetical protein